MKNKYQCPSVKAIQYAEEPLRGIVFSCSAYMESEKIIAGTDRLMADVPKTGAEASTNEHIPNTK